MITKPKTVPELRFPGFEGAWGAAALGEIAEIKLGKMLDKEKQTTGHLLPYLNNISLRWNEVDTSNLPRMYFRDNELDRFGLRSGDVVVCEGGEPGRAALWDGRMPDLKFQKAIHRVRFNVPFEQRLLVLYLERIAGSTKFEMLFTGGGIKYLTRETFSLLQIPMISLPEQRKIADFLTAVDRRIGQLSQKKALLEDYKKGVMQQLFTQALRFKDDHGNDFPEWEEKTLGEIGSVVGGGTPDSTNDTYWNGDVQWFTPTEIRSKFVGRSKRTISTSGLKNCSASVLPAGTLLFTSRATIAEVSIATEPCTTNQGFQSITVNQDVGNEFIYYWVIHFKKEFLRKAQGSTFLEIGGKEVRKMPLLLPSFHEQTKIANFLTALDRKIESVSQQISHTQSFKKGLLQQMFV